ncbi:ParB/RepB/Spo0J family partition protein [Clostridium neonatale]|uniref:ParB/RepB/Spo0J family partition protein n=1 Tax=Clostridium neonatale TaxID=137838 RepID=UPI003D337C5A
MQLIKVSELKEHPQNKVIISGHQRLKACKDLGIKKVPVIIREDLDTEEEKLKKLLATNFGRMKNDPTKQRKVAVEYVELCGNKHGTNQWSGDNRQSLTQEEIAQNLGISQRTLRELLEIERKLTPEIKQLLDEGVLTKTTCSKILVKLTPEEQQEVLSTVGSEALSQMTQKQVQEEVNKIKNKGNEELTKLREDLRKTEVRLRK